MTRLTVKAALATVATAEGLRHIGFAEGAEDEPYALFTQGPAGGPVTFEVNDDLFAAEDAVTARPDPKGLLVTIDPAHTAAFGFATEVLIELGPRLEGLEPALKALRKMLGARFAD